MPLERGAHGGEPAVVLRANHPGESRARVVHGREHGAVGDASHDAVVETAPPRSHRGDAAKSKSAASFTTGVDAPVGSCASSFSSSSAADSFVALKSMGSSEGGSRMRSTTVSRPRRSAQADFW